LKTFTQSESLTDTELDRLAAFLKSCKGGRAMNIEQLDGFFAGLIAGPETVMPSEYNREAFSGEMSEACEFGSLDEAKEILGLMMRLRILMACCFPQAAGLEHILSSFSNTQGQSVHSG
jgi:uncharacterized protein